MHTGQLRAGFVVGWSLVCITHTPVWSLSVLPGPAQSRHKGQVYLRTLQKGGQMGVTGLNPAGAVG